MIKTFTTLCLVLATPFIFTSCGDSKDSVIDDSIELMEDSIEAIASGDKDAMDKIKMRTEELHKRAKELGVDLQDYDSLSDKQKEKINAAKKKVAGAVAEKLKKTLGQ